MIKFLKILLNLYNKLLVTTVGSNSDLFCRIDKRHKESNIYIGKNCLLNGRLVTETNHSKIIIKDNVFIGGKTIIDCKDEVVIEDNVLISYECIIADHDSHSLDANKRENDLHKFKNNMMNWQDVISKKITIKKNAWICTRSIILKGVTIGEGAIVAAGSVVTSDVDNYTLVAGNPAVFKKKLY
jgi:acetyltransferase-like isoleucine patch superfamily enzyme